jgi:hypothetical protein
MDRRIWNEPVDEQVLAEDIALAAHELLRITDGSGLLVYVLSGQAWLTQERDRRDTVLSAGRWYRLDRDGKALVSAFEDTRLTVSAPLSAKPRWRIARVRAGDHARAAKRGHRYARAFWAWWLRRYRIRSRRQLWQRLIAPLPQHTTGDAESAPAWLRGLGGRLSAAAARVSEVLRERANDRALAELDERTLRDIGLERHPTVLLERRTRSLRARYVGCW